MNKASMTTHRLGVAWRPSVRGFCKKGQHRSSAPRKFAIPRTKLAMTDRKSETDAERIAKRIARAGLCSRREAEQWILAGRVAVNGKTIASPALDVSAADRIWVDGKPLPGRERTRLFLHHKPRGLVTSARDPQGRPTIV